MALVCALKQLMLLPYRTHAMEQRTRLCFQVDRLRVDYTSASNAAKLRTPVTGACTCTFEGNARKSAPTVAAQGSLHSRCE